MSVVHRYLSGVVTRAKPTNYLILGFWSPTLSYKLSDAGIPVVMIADSTSLGYSVYSLVVNSSTIGASPAGTGKSQWKLVESAEFIFMQNAYIERLQAALVTAEAIEALMIRTKNLVVLEGAKIGSFDIGDNYIGNGAKDGTNTNGMSLWDDFLVFNKTNRQVLIGPTSSLGLDFLGRFYDTRQSSDHKHGISINVSGGMTNTALGIVGDVFMKGGFIPIESTFTAVGSNVIYDNIRRFTSYYLKPTADHIVYVPTRTQLLSAFGSTNMPEIWSITITVAVDVSAPAMIYLRGQSSTGDIRDSRGDIVNFYDEQPYGGIRMAKGNSVVLRFYSNSNSWLLLQHGK